MTSRLTNLFLMTIMLVKIYKFMPKQKNKYYEKIPLQGYSELPDLRGELQQYQNGQKRTVKAEKRKRNVTYFNSGLM